MVVPPVKFGFISSTLGLKQGWSIDNDAKLIDLRQMIKSSGIVPEDRTEHDWDKKRAARKVELKKQLKHLAPATNVSAAEYKIAEYEVKDLMNELAALQDAYEEAMGIIEQLKVAKDLEAVKAITLKRAGFNPEKEFNELLGNISKLRPKTSINFYRNMIMDLYNKASQVNWYDHDQKADAEAAIQYNIMESEFPFKFNWRNKKLKGISAAVTALQNFIDSDEAVDFVEEREKNGETMELDDLEFCEEHLS